MHVHYKNACNSDLGTIFSLHTFSVTIIIRIDGKSNQASLES